MAYSSILGRRYREPYQQIIESVAPYKMRSKIQQTQSAQEQAAIDLSRESLDFEKQRAMEELGLQRDMFDESKKQGDRASVISGIGTAANLGLTGAKVYDKFFSAPAAATVTGGMSGAGPTIANAANLATTAGTAVPAAAASSMATTPAAASIINEGMASAYGPAAESVGYETATSTAAQPAAAGMSGADMLGWGGAAVHAGMGIDRVFGRGSQEYPGGSRQKIGTGIGATAGGIYGGIVAGPLGSVVGSTIGEMTGPQFDKWFGAPLEKIDDSPGTAVVELSLDPVLKGADIITGGKISEAIDESCIVLTACYGPYSPEVRYAKVFCGRCLDLPALIGYYQIGKKTVDAIARHKWLKAPIKALCTGPFVSYIKHRLGRKDKISVWARVFSTVFLSICRQVYKRTPATYFPPGAKKCISSILSREV